MLDIKVYIAETAIDEPYKTLIIKDIVNESLVIDFNGKYKMLSEKSLGTEHPELIDIYRLLMCGYLDQYSFSGLRMNTKDKLVCTLDELGTVVDVIWVDEFYKNLSERIGICNMLLDVIEAMPNPNKKEQEFYEEFEKESIAIRDSLEDTKRGRQFESILSEEDLKGIMKNVVKEHLVTKDIEAPEEKPITKEKNKLIKTIF